MVEFDRDLQDIFGARYPDLQPKLKELLLELWLRGTKLGHRLSTPTSNPNNGMHPRENFGPEMRFDEATGFTRTLSEQESLSDLEYKLNLLNPDLLNANRQGLENQIQTIIQQNGSLFANTLQSMGIPNSYDLVPVVMNSTTGEMFGVDVLSRQKITHASTTLHLENNDGFGHQWDMPGAMDGPPTKNDLNASHVICRVDGVVKTSPTDYSITTFWSNGEDRIQYLWFHIPLDTNVSVELSYPDFQTEYF
jgi:hypothetical protein